MNRRTYTLSIIILLVGVLACEVSSLVPIAVPTITPDRVATGVAEQKAIAATLTAEVASRVNQTPSPSKTATPTLISLSASPTTIEARTITPMATSTREGKLVQGSVYGSRVVSVEKADSYYNTTRGVPWQYIYPAAGQIFLKIGVELYKNGVLSWDDKERLELSVIDSEGKAYTLANSDLVIMDGTLDPDIKGQFDPTDYVVYFSVPNIATGFRLRYRDLPLIDLVL